MRTFYASLCLAILLVVMAPAPQRLKAHGGVLIDSGFTRDFEWLVSIDPYPITTGQAIITFLLFDVTTYDPVSDLRVTLSLAAPGTRRPCCEAATLSPPIALVIDPQLYPGDYSAVIAFDQPGDWAAQFVVKGDDRAFTVVAPVAVAEAARGQAPVQVGTPDAAATATVFAQNVQQARQRNTILATDPAAPSPFRHLNWWFYGVVALIPITMGWLLLRQTQRQLEEPIPWPDEFDNGNES